MKENFIFDERLGIKTPKLQKPWSSYTNEEQAYILLQWEKTRGRIPDRIRELEKQINMHQDQLSVEENFERSCHLNYQISSLASIINDLWLWYRLNQQISSKLHG
jgi:hypothetical protein